jgi:hypothetical protein
MATTAKDVENQWQRFLGDHHRIKMYPKYLASSAGLSGELRHPYLDNLIASILFVNLIAFLDDTFIYAIKEKILPEPDRQDLDHRIQRLAALLADSDRCQSLRKRRNTLAHSQGVYCDWEELDGAINSVEVELKCLRYVGERPVLIYAWD